MELLVNCYGMVAADLPWTGDALWNGKTKEQLLLHLSGLSCEDWTRPNQAHIAAKNVQQLRQFV